MAMKEGRRRSPAHEARWLNLLGFSLRPGYGLAVDDWRVAETWRHVRGKLVHAGASGVEALILWRRISGGLTAGQQTALAEPLISSLRTAHAMSMTSKNARGVPAVAMHESSEAWRLLGSLELLDVPVKVEIGNMIVDLIEKRKYEKVRNPMIWSLGRLGQRQPLHGPLNTVVPQIEAGNWCDALLKLKVRESSHLALMQLARHTGDRYRDLDIDDSRSCRRLANGNRGCVALRRIGHRGGHSWRTKNRIKSSARHYPRACGFDESYFRCA